MKLSFDSSNLAAFPKKHFSLVLAVCLFIVILLEVTVIKRSVDLVLRVKNQVPNVQTRIVRVNVPLYTELEKQIEADAQFESSNPPALNPFGLAPTKAN